MSENLDVLRSIEDEPIKLEPYDPTWSSRFETERAVLQAAIGNWAIGGIHHVGSTAVLGMDAKPIIDILVGVQDLDTSRACFDQLAARGYKYAPYRAQEMHWFCKPDARHRTHHLHLAPVGSRRYRDELKASGLDIGQMSARGAQLYHVRDAKVTRIEVYFDRDRALADLGLAPEADSR